MEDKLRAEILNAIQQRQKLDLAKISFITVFFGLGGIKLNDVSLLKEIYFLIPIIAICFDMLIQGQNFTIRRIGLFLKNYSRDRLEREYEVFMDENRDKFFKYSSLIITILSLIIAGILVIYIKGFEALTPLECIWFGIMVILIILIHSRSGSIISSLKDKDYKIIKATVAGIVTKKGDPKTIYLTKRGIDPYKGQWCLPGGHIDANETTKSAVNREVEEETKLHFKGKFFRYFDEIIPDRNHHNVVMVFIGEGTSNDKRDSPEQEKLWTKEVVEAKWINIEQAAKLDLAFGHNSILKSYIDHLNTQL